MDTSIRLPGLSVICTYLLAVTASSGCLRDVEFSPSDASVDAVETGPQADTAPADTAPTPDTRLSDTSSPGTPDGATDTAPPDRDRDRVPDGRDNCPDQRNPRQLDRDDDGEGDLCEDVIAVASADASFTGASPEEQFGTAPIPGDVNGDGALDLAFNSPYANPDGEDSGALYLHFGPIVSNEGVQSQSSADLTIVGTSENELVGWSAAIDGDVDGDGRDDILIGTPFASQGAGRVALFLSKDLGAGTTSIEEATLLLGGTGRDFAGAGVAFIPDLDGDQKDDILIGAPGAQDFQTGRAYVVYSASLGDDDFSLGDADAILIGESEGSIGERLETSVDFDADGTNDIILSDPHLAAKGANSGGIYVLDGAQVPRGTIELRKDAARFIGDTAGGFAGHDIDGVGDFNGDGFPDIGVGIIGDKTGGADAGAACVLFGRSFAAGESSTLCNDGLSLVALNGARAGSSVEGIGDVDEDGYDDLLVGAPGGTNRTGGAYLVLGRGTSEAPLSLERNAIFFEGEGDSRTGARIEGGHDLDGDGRPDFLIAAPEASSEGTENHGAAFFFSGP